MCVILDGILFSLRLANKGFKKFIRHSYKFLTYLILLNVGT